MGDNLHSFVEEDDASYGDTVLIEETVVWDNNEDIENESNFVEVNDPTRLKVEAVDENQSYMTADEDFDQTRYFSILDTSVNEELVLPDISGLPLDTSKSDSVTDELNVNQYINADPNESLQLVMDGTDMLEPDLSLNNPMVINDEVFLYKMEGTDDIYAIQTADDGNGNLQRYQFKVRINDLGQYEAIPGTIEIQSEDSPLAQALNQVHSGDRTMIQEPLPQTSNIKQEKSPLLSPELPTDYMEEQAEESSDFLVVNEDEIAAGESETEHYEEIYVTDNINGETVQRLEDMIPSDALEKEKDSLAVEEEDIHNEANGMSETEQTQFHAEFLKESHEANEEEVEYLEEAYQENDFEEEYHTVEGHHITGDSEEDGEQQNEFCISAESFQQHLEQEQQVAEADEQELLKLDDALCNSSELHQQTFPKKENVSYFILKPQLSAGANLQLSAGANLQLSAGANLQQASAYNPRSLLKKTYAARVVHQRAPKQSEEREGDEQLLLPRTAVFAPVRVNSVPKANILNKTNKSSLAAIPAPPAAAAMRRQTRQPRKQAITPIERIGSEIIVQEVTFSGNGNVLTAGNFLLPPKKRQLNANEVYQISDSDEDYTPQKAKMRNSSKHHKRYKRKASKLIEITISDSEDNNTDESVIEVSGSDDEDDDDDADTDYDINKENIVGSNRKRKPQNRLSSTDDAKFASPEISVPAAEREPEQGVVAFQQSPPKRKRGRPPKAKSIINTPAEEPAAESNGKLNDSSESRNSKRSSSESHASSTDILEKAFKCAACTESFKTKFLLVKHEECHNANKKEVPSAAAAATAAHKCSFCDKSFSTNVLLTAHKKMHAKKQLSRNTCLYKVSPRKLLPQKTVFKTPNNNASAAAAAKVQFFKCDECGKACATLQQLQVHRKLHVLYPCANCKLSFNSKLLLTNHVRQECVKSPRTLRNARTCVAGALRPPATAGSAHKRSPDLLKTPNLVCAVCGDAFKTHTTLYRHRRIVHENCVQVVTSSAKKTASSSKKTIRNSGVPLLLKCQTNLEFKFSKPEKNQHS